MFVVIYEFWTLFRSILAYVKQFGPIIFKELRLRQLPFMVMDLENGWQKGSSTPTVNLILKFFFFSL